MGLVGFSGAHYAIDSGEFTVDTLGNLELAPGPYEFRAYEVDQRSLEVNDIVRATLRFDVLPGARVCGTPCAWLQMMQPNYITIRGPEGPRGGECREKIWKRSKV